MIDASFLVGFVIGFVIGVLVGVVGFISASLFLWDDELDG